MMRRKKDGFRQQLGISQEMLAAFLGISRSALNLYERGERFLPTAVFAKKRPIQGTVDSLSSYADPASLLFYAEQEAILVKKQMEKRIFFCQYRLLKLNLQLQKLRDGYTIAMNALKVSGILLAELPKGEEEENTRKWLKLLEGDAWHRVSKYGKAAQAKLLLQINVFEFEINTAQKIINDFS